MSFGFAPHELLRAIFLRTFAPSFLLNPDIVQGPRPAWCQSTRDKKSIMLVCQSWCAVGTEFLYEDVVLRRIVQVPAFLRSLEENVRLVPLVKSLTVRCFVPSLYENLFETDIELILEHCIDVKKIAIFTSFGEKPSYRHFPGGFLDITGKLAPQLSERTIPFVEMRVSVDILSTFVNLRELCIPKCMLNRSPYFPVLESLSITAYDEADFRLPSLCHPWEWSMPALRNVRFAGVLRVHAFQGAYWEEILKVHGAGIKYFDVDCHPSELQGMIDLCPNLEHLVTTVDQYHPNNTLYCALSHRTVKYLDLRYCISNEATESMQSWSTLPPPALQELMNSPPQGLKSIVSIRYIDSLLGNASLQRVLAPQTANSGGSFQAFEFKYPGVHIRCEEHQIIRQDLLLINDEDSDDEYAYDSESDLSDISSGHSDESSLSGEIDHDTALLIFGGMLEITISEPNTSGVSDSK